MFTKATDTLKRLILFFYQNVFLMSICMHCCDERPQRGSCVLACLSQFDTNQITDPVTVQDGLIVGIRIKVHLRGVVGRVLISETPTVAPRQPASFAVSITPQLQFCLCLNSFVLQSSWFCVSPEFLRVVCTYPACFSYGVCVYISVDECAIFIFCLLFLAVWNKPEFHRKHVCGCQSGCN